MGNFVQTIRFKIIFAFGVCVMLMAAIGVFGMLGLTRLNANMTDEYRSNTVPIADLSELREASLDIRLQLRRIQVYRDQEKASAGIEKIRSDEERIGKAWNRYYPGGVSSGKEREIAEKIKNDLEEMVATSDEAVVAFGSRNYDAAIPAVDKTGVSGNALRAALNEDAALNLAQAQQFVVDSSATFRTTLWIGITLLGVGIVVAVGVSAYVLRAISRLCNFFSVKTIRRFHGDAQVKRPC
jgi:hypothetical protein